MESHDDKAIASYSSLEIRTEEGVLVLKRQKIARTEIATANQNVAGVGAAKEPTVATSNGWVQVLWEQSAPRAETAQVGDSAKLEAAEAAGPAA